MSIYTGSTNSSSTLNTQTLTTSGNVTSFNSLVLVDTTSGNITVTLPTAISSTKGQSVTIKKVTNDNNCVLITGYNTDTIENNSQVVYLYNKGDAITLCNTIGNSNIISDNRNSTGSSANYLYAERVTGQTTGLSAGSQIIFTNATKQIGSNISLNTTTGVVTIAKGSSYSIKSAIGVLTGTNAIITYVLEKSIDGTTWTPIGVQAVNSSTDASYNYGRETTAHYILDVSATTYIRTTISSISGATAIGYVGMAMPWIEVDEINKQATITNTADTLYTVKTAVQSLSVAGDVTFVKQSGNLAFDGTYVTLLPGKTYSISSGVLGSESTSTGYVELAFTDDSNVILGGSRFVSRGVQYGGATNSTEMPNCEILYTPTTNTKVKVRATNVINGTHNFWDGSYFKVVQIGNSAVSSIGGNYIDASWIPYTPTLGATVTTPALSTSSTLRASYSIVGKTLKLNFFYSQSATSTNKGVGCYLINLPTGHNINTALTGTETNPTYIGVSTPFNGSQVGTGYIKGYSSQYYGAPVVVIPYSSTQLLVYTGEASGIFWGSGIYTLDGFSQLRCSFNAEIPIL
jgi:hypothetical protein